MHHNYVKNVGINPANNSGNVGIGISLYESGFTDVYNNYVENTLSAPAAATAITTTWTESKTVDCRVFQRCQMYFRRLGTTTLPLIVRVAALTRDVPGAQPTPNPTIYNNTIVDVGAGDQCGCKHCPYRLLRTQQPAREHLRHYSKPMHANKQRRRFGRSFVSRRAIMTKPRSVASSSASSNTTDDTDKDDILSERLVTTPFRKLKPRIVNCEASPEAASDLYQGKERDIRHSPWRMNLVCQLAAGLPLLEALQQLEFCPKKVAPLVKKVLIRTSNLADIRDNLQPSQL